MREHGCNITDDPKDLERFILQAVESPRDLALKIIERRQSFMNSESASETILKALGGDNAA
jgi:uncharacterized protein (DUF1778 family)